MLYNYIESKRLPSARYFRINSLKNKTSFSLASRAGPALTITHRLLDCAQNYTV